MVKFIRTGIIVLGLVLATIATPVFDEHKQQMGLEGRGFGSAVWGWITDPFGWWTPAVSDATTAGADDIGIVSEAVGPAPPAAGAVDVSFGETPNDDKVNTTVWCNDQTCTTVRCSNGSCIRVTCNIYDTNVHGECSSFVPGIITEPSVSLEEQPIVVVSGQEDTSSQAEESLKVIQLPIKDAQKGHNQKVLENVKNGEVRVSNRL